MGACPCKAEAHSHPLVELVVQDDIEGDSLPSLLGATRSAASASKSKHAKQEEEAPPSLQDGNSPQLQPVERLAVDGSPAPEPLGEDESPENASVQKQESEASDAGQVVRRTIKARGTVEFLETIASEEQDACSCSESLDRRVSSSESEPEFEPAGERRVEEEPSRPDFSGSWLCTRVEGNWDAYLKETGVSWGTRVAVSSMGYGVGKQLQHIEQSEDRIRIVNVVKCCPPREASCTYRTNGLAEEIVDLEGKPTTSTTRWEGRSLVTEQVSISPRETLPTALRKMKGSEMCTERSTKSGLVVRRFYTRQK